MDDIIFAFVQGCMKALLAGVDPTTLGILNGS